MYQKKRVYKENKKRNMIKKKIKKYFYCHTEKKLGCLLTTRGKTSARCKKC